MAEMSESYKKRRRISQRNYRQRHKEQVKQRDHEYYLRTKKARLEYASEYSKKNRAKRNAAARARYHIKDITKCEVCGSTEDLCRHHPDYNNRLSVKILCKTCHARLHFAL